MPDATHSAPEPKGVALHDGAMPHARELILLGASTGGVEALAQVIRGLPRTLPPILIVQHIPAGFSKAMADRLNSLGEIAVREATDREPLRRGTALVAPGDFHLQVEWRRDGYRARVMTGPAVWHQRPAVDILFASAADSGPAAYMLAGVFTGMGRDGAEGLLRLRHCGATTFAQDERSSVVYGMPRAAWENGGAARQLPLEQIPEFITRHFIRPVVTPHARLTGTYS